ncbi:hypothetical protein BAS09_02650 [Elizabethkingia ursingii]|jgi:hypothetical protein|uniref:hypothetical protein n=1 Tax=Elizabethkingia ursingii TaxID=1756150 RepID=UPI00099A5539|nr:hypothetical protein [Elizabethkingia ursingii]MDR2228612.1 hypothetical protein [Flavobacteriaceae bacterium]OPC06497.1 hypothetical protein BAS09_02650 [Elizabethkingia ursingii]
MRKKTLQNEAAIINEKACYVHPELKVVYVEMETGVAASSATLSPGDATSPGTPQIDDWYDSGNIGDKNYDL